MSFDRPSASRLKVALFAAAALIATPALAQTPPKPAPGKPAAPAQAPAQQAAPAQPAGPTIVQVKPEPSQPDWVKVCGKDQAAGKEICYTTRDFVSDQGQPVLAVAVYDIKGEANRMVRFLMPLGLLLQPGVRFAVDQGKAEQGRFAICLPNGCFAEGQMNDATIGSLKKATSLNISVQNQFAREVTFQVPMTNFAKAFDGPPIDPAVLEQQQRQLQEQMQKQAEEMRKKLESSGGAAPAPGAPAPAAPKP